MEQGGRPLRRDAQVNRQRILDAAEKVFAERGLTATLDDVADRAGVGVGTVYRRFPTKEALLEATLDERIREYEERIQGALDVPNGWDGLVMFLEVASATHSANRGLRDIALGSDIGSGLSARLQDRIFPLIEEVVKRAHDEGTLRPDVTAGDVPLLLLMITEVAHHSHAVRPDAYRRYLGIVIDGLRRSNVTAGLGPPLTRPEVNDLTRSWLPRAHPARASTQEENRT